ncbi:MAG: alpha/beta hydrolase [Acidimicrobiales bacterium]
MIVGEERNEADVDPDVLSLARDMIRTNCGHVDHDSEERRPQGPAPWRRSPSTLAVVGRHDRHEVRTLAAEVAKRCPDAELHVLDGAAHLVALERPDVIVDLIRQHIGRHPAPAG